MKVTQFNKDTLRAIRSEMEAVLEKYGAKSNLQFEVGNMRFSDAEVDIKVKAVVKGAKTRTDEQLELMAKLAGITKFENSRGEKLVKYNSRSYKYPYVYQGANGQMYKCSEAQAKMLFA